MRYRYSVSTTRGLAGWVVAFAAAATPVASAQVIRGTVTDSTTSKPLQAAVELLAPDGRIVVQVISGPDGRYLLRAPAPDSFVVRVRRIGYVGMESDLVGLGASTDAALEVRLVPRALIMPGVTVSAQRGSAFLETVGYYRRKQETTGYFLDPDRVDKLATKAKQTADLVDGIPGVTIRSYRGSWGVRVPVLTRQLGCAGTEVEVGENAFSPTSWPRIYVDGMLMNLGVQGFDLNTVPAHEILAIEVYDSVSETPLQYGGTDSTCGVLVIWTKR